MLAAWIALVAIHTQWTALIYWARVLGRKCDGLYEPAHHPAKRGKHGNTTRIHRTDRRVARELERNKEGVGDEGDGEGEGDEDYDEDEGYDSNK